MKRPALTVSALAVLALASLASAARIVVEDWTAQPVAARGIPRGWTAYATPGGRAGYDFTIVDEEGRRALRVRSHDEHSTIAREVQVDLAATPMLEWSWKAVELPAGADVRDRATSDLAAYVLVVWPRFPEALRSRIIAYAWGTAEPAGSVQRSRKTSTVSFFILRSGAEQLGQWLTERRDVVEDYRRIYGEAPESPRVVAISIDTNDTHSRASALIGAIAFTGR
jgi:ABC-type amino acid transport substrate-binding protein